MSSAPAAVMNLPPAAAAAVEDESRNGRRRRVGVHSEKVNFIFNLPCSRVGIYKVWEFGWEAAYFYQHKEANE